MCCRHKLLTRKKNVWEYNIEGTYNITLCRVYLNSKCVFWTDGITNKNRNRKNHIHLSVTTLQVITCTISLIIENAI